MCGISGVFSLNNVIDPLLIKKMSDVIVYRGPDGFGYMGYNTNNKFVSTFANVSELNENCNLLFGHRRLSIIDLSNFAHQPMSYKDKRYWITYNGEIYNYIELKNELIKKGYKFVSNTDTEVILASYNEWGCECLSKFNGMWAFAILDVKTNKLFLSRDRFGIKPLYYTIKNGTLVFSSEIKQILVTSLFQFSQNNNALIDYFYNSTYNSIKENTFFNNIFEFQSGCYAIIDLNESTAIDIQQIRYWRLENIKKINYRIDKEYTNHYLDLFVDSINLRLRSDVALGAALSGGLDSSGIVCVLAKLLKQKGLSNKLKTFTSMSDVEKYDETEYAQAVIDHTGAQSFYTIPTADKLIEDYEKLIWHQEEPFIGTSIFAGWCVSELIRRNNVIVTLDGQGPDEMLGGYYPYAQVLMQNLMQCNYKLFRKNYSYYKEILGVNNLIVLKSMFNLIKPKMPASLSKSFNQRKRIFSNDFINDYLFKYANVIKYKKFSLTPFDKYSMEATLIQPLPGILKQVDRNSMAFSIESRLPFLDYRLVEFTFAIPDCQKVNGVSKFIYRNAVREYLPEKINNRKNKLGFVTAEPIWLKQKNVMRLFNQVYNSIEDNSIISKNEILRKYHSFCIGEENFSPIFWKVFNYQVWNQQFNVK